MKSRNLEIKVRKELGIEQKLLTQKEVLDLEPNLQPVFDAGVIYESAMHARDPHGILKRIFKNFPIIGITYRYGFRNLEKRSSIQH